MASRDVTILILYKPGNSEYNSKSRHHIGFLLLWHFDEAAVLLLQLQASLVASLQLVSPERTETPNAPAVDTTIQTPKRPNPQTSLSPLSSKRRRMQG